MAQITERHIELLMLDIEIELGVDRSISIANCWLNSSIND